MRLWTSSARNNGTIHACMYVLKFNGRWKVDELRECADAVSAGTPYSG